MKIRTVKLPGKRGTKSLVKEYGNQLVCVRYRYDYFNRKKYKACPNGQASYLYGFNKD